jgi:hypothetical protein
MLLAASPAAVPHPDRSSPAAIVASFYRWYPHAAVLTDVRGMRLFFTPRLAEGFRYAEDVQNCTHDLVIDYDPFAAAQVPYVGSVVRAAQVRGSRARVTVTVTLWKHMHQNLTLATIRSGSGWRIDDIIDPQGRSESIDVATLRAQLRYVRRMNAEKRACLARIPAPRAI